MTDDEIIERIWHDRRRWSEAAGHLKREVLRWRLIVLVLAVTGAVLATAADTVITPRLAGLTAGAGVVALALVPFLTARFLTTARVSRWLRARSVSEGVKSEIFRFRAGAAPYRSTDALALLDSRVKDIRRWARDLEVELPAKPTSESIAPATLGPDEYMRERVRKQIERYYRPKARTNSDAARLFHGLEITAGALAAVFAALAAVEAVGALGPWVAVLTTVGAAFAAHTAANRYEFQAATYAATARELDDLEQGWTAANMPTEPEAWSALVSACEEAISSENRAWMAKLDEPVAGVADMMAKRDSG